MSETDLYEQHRDSVAEKNETVKDRNRFFAMSLVGVGVLCAYAYSPEVLSLAARSWFAQYGIDATVSGVVLQSSLWVFVLYVFTRYLQAVMSVERLYLYLRKLESKLPDVTREGEDYDSLWGGLSRAIDFLYKCFFIAVIDISLVVKSVTEIRTITANSLFDVACCVAIVLLSILYWFFLVRIERKYESEAHVTKEEGNS